MTKTFTLGIITGIGSLALAVPLLATVSSAEESNSEAASAAFNRPVPTQVCLEARADLIDVQLEHVDEVQGDHETLMQEHAADLREIASIEDDDARQAALEELRGTMRDARGSFEPSDEVQAAMDAVKEACGNVGFGFGKGMMGGRGMGAMHGGRGFGLQDGMGPMHEEMLEELGMTQEEFDAALESGTTPREIFEEAGIEHPRGMMGGMMGRGRGMGRGWGNASSAE